MSEAKEEEVRLFREFESLAKIKTLPYHQKSPSRLLGDASNALAAHDVPAAWDFLRVTRASTTLDASLMFLAPDISYLKMAQRHVEEQREREQKRARDPKLLRAQFANLFEKGGMVGNSPRTSIPLGDPPALPGRQPKFDFSGSMKAEPPS